MALFVAFHQLNATANLIKLYDKICVANGSSMFFEPERNNRNKTDEQNDNSTYRNRFRLNSPDAVRSHRRHNKTFRAII